MSNVQSSPLSGFCWYAPGRLPTMPEDPDWNLWAENVGALTWVKRCSGGWELGGWKVGYGEPPLFAAAVEAWVLPKTFPTAQAAIDWVNFVLEMES